ncbi:hypothetical protein ROZALSC1DRAFT_27384, partial [Rozella allomycis CSF55]
MTIDAYVSDGTSQIWSKYDLKDQTNFSFRTHGEPRDYKFCTKNVMENGYSSGPTMKIQMELIVETGYDMFEKPNANEKIKPIEEELIRLESVMANIVDTLSYQEQREVKLRDTN